MKIVLISVFVISHFLTFSHFSKPESINRCKRATLVVDEFLERKKGMIKKELPSRFIIESDDGNEYYANKKPGFQEDDEVFHSEPTNGYVIIEELVTL